MNIIITVFSIIVTIGIYYFSRIIAKKYPSPFTSPVILSTVLIIFVLLLMNISYDDYSIAKDVITYFLGPATVALAVPIYKQRHFIRKYFLPTMIGMMLGTISTITSALLFAQFFQLATMMTTSFSLKSITIPVAAEVSTIVGGDELLVAAFVMITGMFGAFIGPTVMSLFNITNPIARGLAMGTIAHGIGTAEMMKEGELQGAISAVAMGITAIFTALIIPYILAYF